MSPDGLNYSSEQPEWCWLSTIKTPQKIYSHLQLMICCFKVQMFIIRAQYLLFHQPDTRKQKKSCKKNNIHRKAGQMAVQPVDSRFLPTCFCSGFRVANLRLSLSNRWCTPLDTHGDYRPIPGTHGCMWDMVAMCGPMGIHQTCLSP